MNKLPYLILAFLLYLTAMSAYAAPLSLTEAVQSALKFNPEVTAADQDVAVARTKSEQIRAQERPQVSLNASYVQFAHTPEMKVPPFEFDLGPLGVRTITLPGLPLANDTVATSSVNAVIPLSTGGRVKYALAQVDDAVAALAARADSRRREVAFAVTRAYLSAVLAQRVAEVSEQAYGTVKQHLAQAEALFQHGQIPRYEVIRAETELANQDRRRLDAHNQAELSLAYLQDLMGTPKDETPTLTTTLNGASPFMLALDDAIANALQASDDMKALEARDRLYENAKMSARAENNPVIAAVASHELYLNEQPFTSPGSIVGITANIPLYDAGLTKAKVTEQSALQERNNSDKLRLENGIRLEVRKYYLDLQSARKALEASDKAVTLAQESLRLATRRFEEGQGTGIEKSDAILALSIAETNLAQARYQYDVAYYGLQKTMGQILAALPPTEGATDAAR